MSPGTRQACADKQRQHPKHHEVVASNRLEAANIYHRQKLNIAGCIFDIFIAGRSLLIDIEPLLKDKANKEKLARILGLTYRTISKGECTNIASLVKFMPFVSDYKERNGKAFEKAKQIIQTIQERRNNGTGR